MPLVTIRTMKGLLDEEQKKELHKRITDLMVEIEGNGKEEFRQLVIISIDEEESINFSMGGVMATPEIMKSVLPDGFK